ncbi:unnamed protein product [Didymodactylos carnosus]|uniref:Single cache domain-containing protein n=1 Tax=Didymodactylos carnosus TaxID=1234261 RepID=A0A8S2EQJ9_9BILA|nr:unnamed protein product [Didymodactylos carnosus]CAF4089494.1 unnamed protein product [Didymodactylos carnosus]
MASNLKKKTDKTLIISYDVQSKTDSKYIRALVAITPATDKSLPPGSVFATPEILNVINQEKVFQQDFSIFNQSYYELGVPFREPDGQIVFYIVGLPTNSILNRITTTRYAIGKIIEYVYGLYNLFKNNKRNKFTYYVKSQSSSQYVAVITTVENENGQLTTGDSISNTKVVNALNNGKEFHGNNINVSGRSYQALYKPYKLFHTNIVLASYILNQ